MRTDCLAAEAVVKRRSHLAEIREGESIEMDVIEKGPQIQITAASSRFDENGLVAVTEKPSPFVVPGVESSRVGVLEPPHALDEVGRGRFDEKVVMIAHEDPGPDPESGALAALAEGFQKEFFVSAFGRREDPVTPVSSGHDVVKGAFILDADLAGHGEGFVGDWDWSRTEFVP